MGMAYRLTPGDAKLADPPFTCGGKRVKRIVYFFNPLHFVAEERVIQRSADRVSKEAITISNPIFPFHPFKTYLRLRL